MCQSCIYVLLKAVKEVNLYLVFLIDIHMVCPMVGDTTSPTDAPTTTNGPNPTTTPSGTFNLLN